MHLSAMTLSRIKTRSDTMIFFIFMIVSLLVSVEHQIIKWTAQILSNATAFVNIISWGKDCMAAGNVKYGNLIESHEALPGHAEISTTQIYTHVTSGH